MPRVGVLLSGCGVYDGTEIHEAVFTLLELARHSYTAVCLAPDAPQLHVVNHATGEVTPEQRNMFVESARIARGAITRLAEIEPDELDALVIPGGFGTAKNHTTWAIDGPAATIRQDVKDLIAGMVNSRKPVVGLCMAPTTIAKALQDTSHHANLTVGSTAESSPYDIAGISEGINNVGSHATGATIREIVVDIDNHIITAPCYMMEASIMQVQQNVAQAIDALATMLGNTNHV